MLVFTWGEAFTGPCPPVPQLVRRLTQASAAVPLQAHVLAGLLDQLMQSCGPAGCPVQLIGHSLGAVLNAYAARELIARGYEIDQMTLLDPAINFTLFSAENFRELLPPWPKVKWIDNYIATDPFIDAGLAQIGDTILGAANFRVATTHVGIPYYYLDTIPWEILPPIQEGFYFSAALGAEGGFLPEDDRPDPIRWNLTIIRSASPQPLPDGLDTPAQPGWRATIGNVHEGLITVGGVTTPAMILDEASDSAIELAVLRD